LARPETCCWARRDDWWAAAFLIGHLIAIWLYAGIPGPATTLSQRILPIVLVPATVAIAWMLPSDRAGAPAVAFYALGLAAMAAFAW
jgi:uncharacterized membrane protein YhhN